MYGKIILNKKDVVLSISYLSAFLLILAYLLFSQYRKASDFQLHSLNVYSSALSDLADNSLILDSAFHKSIFSASAELSASLFTEAYGAACSAKLALSHLIPADLHSQALNAISLCSDFSYRLARISAAGIDISSDDRDNLKSFASITSTLSNNFADLISQVNSGSISLLPISSNHDPSSHIPSISDALLQISLPSLPEPSSVTTASPKLLEGSGFISSKSAANAASAYLGTVSNNVKFDGERISSTGVPVYVFSAKSDGSPISIEVTKSGGYIASAYSASASHSSGISHDDAIIIAKRFLNNYGYKNMSVSSDSDLSLSSFISFIYNHNGTLCYPDRITISVGRDSGRILEVDCLDYIMNHHNREIPKPKINLEKASDKLSDELSVISHTMAIIETSNNIEAFCYEFTCQDSAGTRVIIYINAETGVEESIELSV